APPRRLRAERGDRPLLDRPREHVRLETAAQLPPRVASDPSRRRRTDADRRVGRYPWHHLPRLGGRRGQGWGLPALPRCRQEHLLLQPPTLYYAPTHPRRGPARLPPPPKQAGTSPPRAVAYL